MINGLEGIPGSGKSYESVVFHVLAALKSGRKVITNLPLHATVIHAIDPAFVDLLELRYRPRPVLGTWDATRIDDKGNGNAYELHPTGYTPPPPRVYSGDASYQANVRYSPRVNAAFGGVWDYYDTWRHPVDGRGPLFVIDECHVPLPKIGADPEVVEWYKLHRHFNADVLLMTQKFRGINQDIADLLAMLIKVRKADILGRKDSYIRKVHAGYRGAVISTDERKYQPQYFPLYKSHTQGLSVAESAAQDVTPMLVKFNRFKWVWLTLTAAYAVYAFWPAPAKPKPSPKPAAYRIAPSLDQAAPSPAHPPSAAPGAKLDIETKSAVVDPDPEPLQGKGVHITGWLRGASKQIYSFAVSQGGQRIFDLSLQDLKTAGYSWKSLGECMGSLTYKGVTRMVVCDAPYASAGTNSAPVVLALGGKQVGATSTDVPSSPLTTIPATPHGILIPPPSSK